ncbi:MAG: class II aldolase/adducin family protein [Pseudolabrys sp.]
MTSVISGSWVTKHCLNPNLTQSTWDLSIAACDAVNATDPNSPTPSRHYNAMVAGLSLRNGKHLRAPMDKKLRAGHNLFKQKDGRNAMQASTSAASARKLAMDPEEWKTRVDLAAAFRLAALQNWDELLFAHLSARVPGHPNQFLMHPAAILFEEVTASNLHKLDERCNHVEPSDELPHKFAFPFHKGIYDAFPQAQCVVHLHTKYATAVAMQEQGLIPGNQYALWLGPIGYHDYEGLLSTDEEGQRLAKNFGNKQIVLQRGHGFVLWGHTIHEAYMLAFLVIRACETQVRSMAGGIKPYIPPQQVLDATIGQARIITDGNAPFNQMTWRALLRKLDRDAPDYKT